MDNDLFRNGSGYVDITAYKAMKNYVKGENSMEFNRGELFEYEMRNTGESKVALVVSADFRSNDRFLNVIVLTDEPKGEVNVAITTNYGIMYADCGMVSFATNDRLINYLKHVKSEEMEQIDAGIAKCLGIESLVIEKEVIKEVPNEAVIPMEHTDLSVDLSMDLAAAKKEAEVYKNLYEALLSKVMG